jgi:hypothetical protein
MTLIISIDSSIGFGFIRNSDGISINILWLTIDIIAKPKHVYFKELIEEYNKHGF